MSVPSETGRGPLAKAGLLDSLEATTHQGAIDLSLHVVGTLPGQEIAAKTAKQIAYPWSAEP